MKEINKDKLDRQLLSIRRKYQSLIAKYNHCNFELCRHMAIGFIDGHSVFVNPSAYTLDVMSVITERVKRAIPEFEKHGKRFYIDVDKKDECIACDDPIVLTPRYIGGQA